MNFYEILKTKKLGRGSPDYWTQLFSEHVGGTGEWKVAGVLPLTFTAKGGTAVDWVIEGNDENGTENMFNINDMWIVAGQTTYSVNEQTLTITGNWYVYMIIPVERNTNYYLGFNTVSSTSLQAVAAFGVLNGELNNRDVIIDRRAVPFILTTGEREQIAVVFYSGFNTVGTSVYDNIMLVKGSTAPDHYIPYQRGVGERTENLVSPIRTANGWKQGYRQKNNGKYITTHNSGEWLYDVYIPIDSTSFTFWATSVSGQASGTFYFFDSIKNYLTNTAINFNNYNNTGISDLPANAAYMQFAFRTFCMSEQEVIDNNYQVMLVKGNTAPQTFIPYGYQIPLTASQQGQPDKTYDIYIGDSPLTEGETVSKTSTGVDIELFGGKNTVSTTLYNKPTMEIKYK